MKVIEKFYKVSSGRVTGLGEDNCRWSGWEGLCEVVLFELRPE